MSETPQTDRKTRRSRAQRAIKRVNLDKAHRKLRTILGRQIDKLMEASYKTLLTKDELANLALCQKLLIEFRKAELEELEAMSDEELEKIAEG
jgi:hypothetical protein